MSADVGGRIKEQLNNKRRHKLWKETKERAADTMCCCCVMGGAGSGVVITMQEVSTKYCVS